MGKSFLECVSSWNPYWLYLCVSAGLHVDGLGQERRNCSALAMELRLSSTNPLMDAISNTQYIPRIMHILNIFVHWCSQLHSNPSELSKGHMGIH